MVEDTMDRIFFGWRLDEAARKLTSPASRVLALSPGEFALLRIFLDIPDRPLSRENMLALMEMAGQPTTMRALGDLVARFRRKLAYAHPIASVDQALIQTVYGVGYALRPRYRPARPDPSRLVLPPQPLPRFADLDGAALSAAIAERLPGLVAYWDVNLKCQFANQAYVEWFGRTPGELIGTSLRDLLGPDLFARNEGYIRAALAGQSQGFDRTLVKPSGEVGHTWAQYIPDFDESETVAGFYVLVTDITDLRQANDITATHG